MSEEAIDEGGIDMDSAVATVSEELFGKAEEYGEVGCFFI